MWTHALAKTLDLVSKEFGELKGIRLLYSAKQAWGQVHGAKYKYKYNYFAKLQVQVQVQVLISRVKYKYKYFEKLQVQVQILL